MTSRSTWQTQGTWQSLSDRVAINSVDRSHSNRFLAIADNSSKIKIFRYPAHHQQQIYSHYKGHSSQVTSVKWSFNDRFLFSTGGSEKSIFQWKVSCFQDYSYEVEEFAKPVKQSQDYKFEDEE